MIDLGKAGKRLKDHVGKLDGIRSSLLELEADLPLARAETSHEDLDGVPPPCAELRAVIRCGVHDHLEPLIWDFMTAAERAVPAVSGPPLDLDRNDEATRQALYERVVADYFTARTVDDALAEPEVVTPPYSAEEAGLEVFHAHGRWFATWLKLEEPAELPEVERRELLRLLPDESRPHGLYYHEA